MNKRISKNYKSNFFTFFLGKKGMEMWQLVLLVIAIILLLFFIVWFGALNQDLGGLFEKLERFF